MKNRSSNRRIDSSLKRRKITFEECERRDLLTAEIFCCLRLIEGVCYWNERKAKLRSKGISPHPSARALNFLCGSSSYVASPMTTSLGPSRTS